MSEVTFSDALQSILV